MEGGKDRFARIAIQKMSSDASITIANIEADYKSSEAMGTGLAKLFFSPMEGTFLDDILNG